jgi:adenine deaminase
MVIAISALAHTGLGNYQALRAATVEPAEDMGVSNQLGTIQPGMIADLDVIHGNPLQNIQTIANDVYVMQNGNLYTPKQLIGPYAAPSAAKDAATQSSAKQPSGKGTTSSSAEQPRRPEVWETPGEARMRTSLDYIMEYMC